MAHAAPPTGPRDRKSGGRCGMTVWIPQASAPQGLRLDGKVDKLAGRSELGVRFIRDGHLKHVAARRDGGIERNRAGELLPAFRRRDLEANRSGLAAVELPAFGEDAYLRRQFRSSVFAP